ncbi:MAG TPA: hypothetical protein VFQ53_24005 [Kofleriaceae bacterium]|nr:hypothetical protein [Kofleriaceae bacterium]
MRLVPGLLPFVLSVAACTDAPVEPTQHMPRPDDPSFTLYVSNQSFDLDRVDITVRIDGELAVTGDFDVEGQHTWIPFDFGLAPGTHEIVAVTQDGDATLTKSFTMDDRKFGVLDFWFYPDGPEPTPRQFSFFVTDEAPLFE